MANETGTRETGSISWWVWTLIGVIVPLGVLLVWYLRQRQVATHAPPSPGSRHIDLTAVHRVAQGESPASRPVAESAPSSPDDLTQIKGIGPKTADALQAAGIVTFSRLAEATLDELRQVLGQAGIRANPGGWPEQARQLVRSEE